MIKLLVIVRLEMSYVKRENRVPTFCNKHILHQRHSINYSLQGPVAARFARADRSEEAAVVPLDMPGFLRIGNNAEENPF